MMPIASARMLLLFAATASLAACASSPAQRAGLRPIEAAHAGREGDDDGGARSPYGLFLAGQAAIGGGASRDAAVYFGRASRETPDTPSIKNRAFSAAILAGDIPRAAAAAPAPGAATPAGEALGRLTRAVEALAEGNGKAAEAQLADTAVAAPHRAAADLLRPWTNLAAGDAERLPAASDLSAPALRSFAALGQAQRLERRGQLAQAEAIYRTELSDKTGAFATAYGGFLERRGRRAEAVAFYDAALARDPDDGTLATARVAAAAGRPAPPLPTLRQGAAQALVGPAEVQLSERDAEVGLTYLRLALRLDPGLSQAWLLVGDAMTAAGDREAAKEAYDHIGPDSPDYPNARGRLALALSAAGDKDGALALARQTAIAAPHNAQVLLIYTELLRDDEQWDASIAVLDRLISAPGAKPDWRLYFLRGASKERAGRWPEAQADLDKALELKPDEPEVLNYLGYAWADRGEKLPQALAMLQKASALKPDSGAIVDSLGWARYRLHDYRAAVADLERAASLDPSDAEVNLHLGDAYWSTGRRLEAQYQWRRVLTLDPDAHMRSVAEARLAGPAAARP